MVELKFSNDLKISKNKLLKLLVDILGDLFQAEEIEIYSCPEPLMPIEVILKTHILGKHEMNLLGHLSEAWEIEISSEIKEIEDGAPVAEGEVGIQNWAHDILTIRIFPTWQSWEILKQRGEEF